MNTLIFLNSNDFEVANDDLLIKLNDLTFVFFYSTQCKYCGPALDVFNTSGSQFSKSNCRFGIINITQNSRVAQISKDTKTPIKYVPLLIAFFKRRPLSVFSSQFTAQNVVNFVQNCYGAIKDKVDTFGEVKKEEEIPAYATGIPVCEEGVCYLAYDNAYKK